jgi:hypothetical protein
MPALNQAGARVRLVAINGNGGAFTVIRATTLCRRVEIIEDFSANAGVGQGIQYQVPNDGTTAGFTTTLSVAPQTEPIILQDTVAEARGRGAFIGNGPDASGGYALPATQIVNLRSASATGTVVRISEFS